MFTETESSQLLFHEEEGLRVEDVLKLVFLALASCQQAADPWARDSHTRNADRDSSAGPNLLGWIWIWICTSPAAVQIWEFQMLLMSGSWQQLQALHPGLCGQGEQRALFPGLCCGGSNLSQKGGKKKGS